MKASNGVQTLGPSFSREVLLASADLTVPVEWILAVVALESGFRTRARNPSGACGLTQLMPQNLPAAGYSRGTDAFQTEPADVQMRAGARFWRVMTDAFKVPAFTSRAAFYCLNLAPARLMHGDYSGETVLYARGKHGSAYSMNRVLDVEGRGDIRIKDLEASLDRAVRAVKTRYDAELEACAVANVAGDTEPPGAV